MGLGGRQSKAGSVVDRVDPTSGRMSPASFSADLVAWISYKGLTERTRPRGISNRSKYNELDDVLDNWLG
ncbi:12006_t:CDS:2, partial [Acaulospora colombiana]